jgi:hypothetical protein
LSSKAIKEGTERINNIIVVGVLLLILLFDKAYPIRNPKYVNAKPMGAAINKQITPSQAKNKSPIQKISSVKYALFRSVFLAIGFLYARIKVEVAPKTKGSQKNNPKS